MDSRQAKETSPQRICVRFCWPWEAARSWGWISLVDLSPPDSPGFASVELEFIVALRSVRLKQFSVCWDPTWGYRFSPSWRSRRHGGGSMGCPLHCVHGQDTERWSQALSWLSSFSFSLQPQPMGWCSPRFKVSFPSSVKPLWRHPQNHTQKCVSLLGDSKCSCVHYDDGFPFVYRVLSSCLTSMSFIFLIFHPPVLQDSEEIWLNSRSIRVFCMLWFGSLKIMLLLSHIPYGEINISNINTQVMGIEADILAFHSSECLKSGS